MSRNSNPKRLVGFYVGLVALTSLAALGISLRLSPPQPSYDLAILGILTLILMALPVELPRGGTVSTSGPLLIAVLLLFGPTALGLVLGAVSVISDLRPKKPLVKVVFNAAQLACSGVIAGWVFVMLADLRGLIIPLGGVDAALFPAVLLPTVLFALAFHGLNTALVGGAISVSTGAPFLRLWTANFSWYFGTQLALAFLGLVLTQLYLLHSWLGLAVFLVPLLVSRWVFESYVSMRQAYADTIRGLVAAIEAKDTYTRGHSERVAELSVKTAGEMGLPYVVVERIELAALLHDLGKIGIGLRLLNKSSSLTPEEFSQVRRHPQIAADIIGAVPFLSDLIPIIVHHHERFDGHGYGFGLSGTQIPLPSRILAVADSYDAMTSARAYKPARSTDEAIAELRRGCGSQFDPKVVEAFLDCMKAETSTDGATLRASGT